MLEQILVYEKPVFLFLNGSNSKLLDAIMWLFSGAIMWIPIAIFFIYSLTYKKNIKEWLPVFLAIGLLILFCDGFSSHICKPLFERFRPTHHPMFMEEVKTIFGYRGGKYGFISGHATNFFGFAMFSALIMKNRIYTFIIFVWAAIIAYSRIYLGVHFISDIVAGMLAGLVLGAITYGIYYQFTKHNPFKIAKPISDTRLMARRIVVVLLINILLASAFSENIVQMIR